MTRTSNLDVHSFKDFPLKYRLSNEWKKKTHAHTQIGTFGQELFLHSSHKVPLSTCLRQMGPWVLTLVALCAIVYDLYQIDLVQYMIC